MAASPEIPELPLVAADEDDVTEEEMVTTPAVAEHADYVDDEQPDLAKTRNQSSILDLQPEDADEGQGRTLKDIYDVITAEQMKPRQRFHHILYGTPALPIDQRISFVYNVIHVAMIIVSVILFIVTSDPQFYEELIQTSGWAFVIESITVAFFTIDFMLRLAAATKLKQVFQLSTLVDFASFIGYYIEVIVSETSDSNASGGIEVQILRVLKLFRVFRLFKLSRSHRGLAMMVQVIAKSKDGLFLLAILVLIATLVFSSVLYYIEQLTATFDKVEEQWIRDDGTRSPFQSIPHTFWFISVSITTVGYGRETPYSIVGRLWVMLVMLFGVLVLSFPNILIGSNFSDVHSANNRVKARKRLGVWFRRVRMVVRFIRMWREFRVKGKVTLFITTPRDALPEKGKGLTAQGSGRKDSHFASRKRNNFIFHHSEFPGLENVDDVVNSMANGNIDDIVISGVPLLDYLQRLLEGFSTCATIGELTESYQCFATYHEGKLLAPRRETLFDVACYVSAAGYTQFFVLNRDEFTGLLMFTSSGMDTLQNFPESSTMKCMRCYSEARDMWTNTAKQVAHNLLPIDGYKKWQTVQKTIDRRSVLDFTYDLKHPDSQRNDIFAGVERVHQRPNSPEVPMMQLDQYPTNNVKLPAAFPFGHGCTCRHCRAPQGAAVGGSVQQEYCFNVDAEYLRMEVALAEMRLRLFLLQQGSPKDDLVTPARFPHDEDTSGDDNPNSFDMRSEGSSGDHL